MIKAKESRDSDGVRVNRAPRASRRGWMLAGGLVAVALSLVAGSIWLLGESTAPATHSQSGTLSAGASVPVSVSMQASGSRAAVPRPQRQFHAVHVERGRPAEASVGHRRGETGGEENVEAQPEIDAREVINALVAAGETEGIAAFPPPGTNPAKGGIVVPEDFELPEGYVKHYQVTDDGRRLAPILMFSPDYEFVDASGHPIELPPDLVVTPELAPPGLPIRMLEIPKRVLH